eukprot:2817695-Rhodomonas_salina.2
MLPKSALVTHQYPLPDGQEERHCPFAWAVHCVRYVPGGQAIVQFAHRVPFQNIASPHSSHFKDSTWLPRKTGRTIGIVMRIVSRASTAAAWKPCCTAQIQFRTGGCARRCSQYGFSGEALCRRCDQVVILSCCNNKNQEPLLTNPYLDAHQWQRCKCTKQLMSFYVDWGTVLILTGAAFRAAAVLALPTRVAGMPVAHPVLRDSDIESSPSEECKDSMFWDGARCANCTRTCPLGTYGTQCTTHADGQCLPCGNLVTIPDSAQSSEKNTCPGSCDLDNGYHLITAADLGDQTVFGMQFSSVWADSEQGISVGFCCPSVAFVGVGLPIALLLLLSNLLLFWALLRLRTEWFRKFGLDWESASASISARSSWLPRGC